MAVLTTDIRSLSGASTAVAGPPWVVLDLLPQKKVVFEGVGDAVNHTFFWTRFVMAVQGAGDNSVATVNFTIGELRLLLRYASRIKER